MHLKIQNEEKASEISPTRSELVEALEYLIEKEDSSDEIQRNNLNKKDELVERTKAEEVRKVAMESLGATKKRRADEKENVSKEPKRRRSEGSKTVAFLREKTEKDTNARAADNELRKAQLELVASAATTTTTTTAANAGILNAVPTTARAATASD